MLQSSPVTPVTQRLHALSVLITILAIICAVIFRLVGIASPDIPLLIAIIITGIPAVFTISYKLLQGDLGADTLAAIAIITAVVLHQYLAAVLIIFMLASGQTLEAYAMRKASSVLLALSERMPSIAHRRSDNKIEDIPVMTIRIGDEIIIYPHEICPVDGVVLKGQGSMDESYLTGEPYLISKAPGTAVISGAINGESVLTITATQLPSDSRYASIVKVLNEAEQRRPSIRRLGDQIGAVFAPIVLLFSLVTWYVTGDAVRFLAVLVIATPCPLLIAIPITIISAISMAAKQAIIIKDPTVLEQLPRCQTAIFDKTGTLTYGKPVLAEVLTAPEQDADFILQNAASLERYSKHPLSSAILEAAEKKNLSLLDAASLSEKPGEGLTGILGRNQFHLTSRKKLQLTTPHLLDKLPPVTSGLECIILMNGEYAATFRFHDLPRKEGKKFIKHLAGEHEFTKMMLVSGDRKSEVNYLGKLLNFTEIYAEVSPEQKLAIVRAERKKAPTLFMGDGINDAPALTAATVGIAFGQYSHVTAEAAGVVIMENKLLKIEQLLHLSLATRRIALQSAIGGMALSIIGMGFAAAGYISPVAGAILQELIDILAIMNALRLLLVKNIQIDFPSS